jgi:hypothetical protein
MLEHDDDIRHKQVDADLEGEVKCRLVYTLHRGAESLLLLLVLGCQPSKPRPAVSTYNTAPSSEASAAETALGKAEVVFEGG